jgi:hypothetical protein
MDLRVPVLVTAFNRPDHLAKCLEALSRVPNDVYVSIDGPRNNSRVDQQLVNECRAIALGYVQDPSRILLFESNLGCSKAVTSAISFMFSNFEKLIIIEDDIIIIPDTIFFLEFCLERYVNDLMIAGISASSYVPTFSMSAPNSPTRLSSYPESWGWATWNNRWNDLIVDGSNKLSYKDVPSEIRSLSTWRVWRKIISNTYSGEIDSWAYRWLFINWRLRRKFVVSNQNLVRNIGAGEDATHTKKPVLMSPLGKLNLDLLKESPMALLDVRADRWLTNHHFQTNLSSRVRFMMRKLR